MGKIIPFFIFYIGLLILLKRINKTQISTMIAIILWYRVEDICTLKPGVDLTLLISVTLLLILAVAPKNIVGKIFFTTYKVFFIFFALYLGLITDYYLNFGVIGFDEINGILQTNTREAFENIGSFLSFKSILFAFIYGALLFLPYLIPNSFIDAIKRYELKLYYAKYICMLFIVLPIIHLFKTDSYNFNYQTYNIYSLIKQNKEGLAKRVTPPYHKTIVLNKKKILL